MRKGIRRSRSPMDWYEDFNYVYDTLDAADSVREEDMQVDTRYFVADGEDD